MSNKNKKGFTLIELIAVIVIIGVLMLIIIPAVSKYIDNSKKETYIKQINSLVDTVRYAINSGDNLYAIDNNEKIFYLENIDLEKGLNTSFYGNFLKSYSYLKVTKVDYNYKYEIQVKDDAGYCISLTDINDLTSNSIIKDDSCNNLIAANEYSIGDIISYADTNWYVIKDSTYDENYLVLLKETILNNNELGSYAINNSVNAMQYYYSSTCHKANVHGYSSRQIITGCNNHNDYDNSNIKTAVEAYMENKKMTNDLKEIDGYKIRLITDKEIVDNLGWKSGVLTSLKTGGNNVPEWVYSNFGENSWKIVAYWTMSKYGENMVCRITHYPGSTGGFSTDLVYAIDYGVRPVINLLKSAISQ